MDWIVRVYKDETDILIEEISILSRTENEAFNEVELLITENYPNCDWTLSEVDNETNS